MNTNKTAVFAHRGFSSRFPENTLAAFQGALDIGVDGIEMDVHLTRDGQIVVIHDDRLERTTDGRGLVGEHTLAELKQLDAGSWFGTDFCGLTIPTLDEVLSLIAVHPHPVRLNIELKFGTSGYPGIEAKTWREVSSWGLESMTIFSSFNHFSLQQLKRSNPLAAIGILYMEALVEPWRYAAFLDASALHPYFPAIDRRTIRDAQEHGFAVNVFTVDEPKDMEAMLQLGVDGVITDVPDILLAMVR